MYDNGKKRREPLCREGRYCMMKRLLCALVCVMVCLTAALAEEPGVRLSLREYTLVQEGECDVTLHLLLYKDGSSAYDLRGLDIGLPEMTAPEGCTIDAAMVALYCTAQ